MGEFERQFISLFYYWAGKLNIDYIPFKMDKRYDCHACIDKDLLLVYNLKKLNEYKDEFFLLLNLIFHELGHAKHKLKYETQEEIFKSEYRAETFAIRMARKYYPEEEKKLERYTKKLMKNKKWIKKNPLYYKVYLKIPEYNI